jgi:hypothetical protein
VSDSTAAPARSRCRAAVAPLPAQRFDADGRVGIDYRAITALALPLMVNSSLQAVISLTDTWFVGHISTTAMAGMAAIFWLVFFFVMLLGAWGSPCRPSSRSTRAAGGAGGPAIRPGLPVGRG